MNALNYITENVIELNAAFSGKLWIVVLAFVLLATIAVLEFRRPVAMKRLTQPAPVVKAEELRPKKSTRVRPAVKSHIREQSPANAAEVRPAY